jgi:site-specific DNA-methyltransferase (adenine-specific)
MSTAHDWKIVEGDALEILRSLPPGEVDAVVADPPYASGGTSNAERIEQAPSTKYVTTGAYVCGPDFVGDNRDQRSHILWSTLWLTAARRAAKPGAVLVIFSDWRQYPATADALQAGGWTWRGTVVWAKRTARPRRGAFRNGAEFALWATNGPFHPVEDAPYLPGVIEAASPRGAQRVHITQKPLDLLDVMVRVAPPNGLVLDPFAGSGTTGVAAIRACRRFLGIEVVPSYAEMARIRIREAAEEGAAGVRPVATSSPRRGREGDGPTARRARRSA